MKKKAAKKTPAKRAKSRRRVGAIGGETMMQVAGSLGGFLVGTIAAQTINNMMLKKDPTKPVNPKLLAVGIGALGIFLPKIAGNSPMVKSVGLGITIAGGSILLKDLKAINGIGNKADVLFLPASSSSMVNGVNKTVSGGVSNTVSGNRMTTRQAAMYQM